MKRMFLVMLALAIYADIALCDIEFCGAKDDTRILWEAGPDQLAVNGRGARITQNETLDVTFEKNGSAAVVTWPGLDLSKHVAVAVHIENVGEKPVTLLGVLNNNPGFASFLHLPVGKLDAMVMIMSRNAIVDKRKDQFVNMRGVPGGHVSHWTRSNPQSVKKLELKDLDGCAVGGTVRIRAIAALGSYGELTDQEVKTYFPFVDEFGQFKHSDWPGKIKTSKDLKSNAKKEKADFVRNSGPKDRSKYGGWKKGLKLKATGHFRTEKHEGKWWLVDPEGYLYWAHGVTCVNFRSATQTAGRTHYFEEMPKDSVSKRGADFSKSNHKSKYGGNWERAAMSIAHKRLKSWGMNSIGNWSDKRICLMKETPYTIPLSPGVGKDNLAVAMKDPEKFRQTVRNAFAKNVQDTKNDKWCVGYFVHNEIKVWKDMDADLYYKIISEELKKAAPKKLYLGSRIHGGDHSKESKAAVKYVDVMSYNRYQFSPASVSLPDDADLPIIIGEFHCGALDRGMLHTGLRGVGSQTQRAFAYRHYVTQALKHPNIVGTHWFQYREQNVTGRGDGENYQIGFVDICDTPYPEIVNSARIVGEEMYSIRKGLE